MSYPRFVILLFVTAALALSGCGKDKPAQAPKPAPKAAEPAKPEASPEAKPAEAKPAEAKPVEEKPKAQPGKALREKVRQAYIDIYCAQIKGKKEEVLAAYKRNGYEDMSAWSKAWRKASKDLDWVKTVMEDAKKACPQ
jgi:hypothetical protein